MAQSVPRVTLMQISDLHVGEIDPNTGDAAVSPLVRMLMANTRWFEGVVGHHARGLQQLTSFWRNLLQEDPGAQIVVSGDVTSCGGWGEFTNADGFVASTLKLRFGQTGLRFPGWQKQSVPGNHDHWPGKPIICGTPDPSVERAFLSKYPRVHTIQGALARPIHLITLNTDSDVSPHGSFRLFAIGCFQTQLAEASAKIAALKQDGLRVLVLHHSWHKKSGILSISRASRAALEQFLEQEQISVMMTGHLHVPFVKDIQLLGGTSPVTVWECRCGTTTQADHISYAAKSILGGFPVRKRPANSLLVHRIVEGSVGIRWSVATYQRDRSGFNLLRTTQIM